MLAAPILVTVLMAGVSSCAQGATSNIDPTSTVHPDLARTPSGQSSPGSSSGAASSSTSGAAGTTQQFVVPEAAKAHTKEGAVEFVKFYLNMLGQLDEHPQTGVIPKFAAAHCKSCQMQEEAGAQLRKERSRVVTQTAEISSISVRPDSTSDSIVVLYRQVTKGSKKVSPSDLTNLQDVDQRSAARADWAIDHWIMGEMGSA